MDDELRRRAHGRRMTIALDEGGLRCRAGSDAVYVPYDVIVDAVILNTFFGRTMLVLDLDREGRDALKIEIANGNPFDVLGAVLAHVTRPHASSRLSKLRRGTQPMAEWLERVRAVARGEADGGYRESDTLGPATLAAVLDDADAAAEERAAAAHALMEIASDEALYAVAHTLVARAVPPIALVAVRFARGGRALVGDDVFSEIRALLADREARDVDAMTLRDDDEIEARIAAALERAHRDVVDALANTHASSGRARRLSQVSAGLTDPSRWVGRSWAL